MNGKLKGQNLIKSEIRAHAGKIAYLDQILVASSAKGAARLSPFFGPKAGLKAPVETADQLHLACAEEGTLPLRVGDKEVLGGSVQLRD